MGSFKLNMQKHTFIYRALFKGDTLKGIMLMQTTISMYRLEKGFQI